MGGDAMQLHKLSQNNTVSRSIDIIDSRIDTDMVLLSVESGKYYSTNDIGARIWELIETPRPVKTVIDLLTTEYEIDRRTCETNVIDFLGQLMQEGLLKNTEPSERG
jgi:hypothetical protein